MGQTSLDKVNRRKVTEINGKRVLQLREQGKSWQQIAWDFGTEVDSVRKAADREALKSNTKENGK